MKKQNNKQPYLSIVIPAYNEEINLKRGVLDSVNEYLKSKDFSWEVIISNDCSGDKTKEIIEDFVKKHKGFRLINQPINLGKGGNVIAGIKESKGDYVLFADMDQSTPMNQFDYLLPKFKEGFDIVIGSRSGRPGQSIIRKIMAYGFAFLRTIVLRLPYIDTQCGFKAFTKNAASEVFSRMEIFGKKKEKSGKGSVTAGFDLEALYIARKLKLKVAEVPVEWYEFGERKQVNPIKDSWEGFRDLMKVRINAFQGKYNV